MKSEERHQLLTNDLGVVTKKVAETFEQHIGTLIALVAGVLVALGIGIWWSSASESDQAAAWTQLNSAQTLEEFGDVVDKFKGKPAGQWALLISSERTLQSGMPLMFTNRELALADVAKAREGFESLLADKNALAPIRERAAWGLALCVETTCDGNTAKPIKAYEQLIVSFPDSMFKTVAEERIAALKTKGAEEFYSWFSKEKPEPTEAIPRDVRPGAKDSVDSKSLNDELDSFIPKQEAPKDKPTDSAPSAENKTVETPEKPNPDKPVEGEQPASPNTENAEKPGDKN